MADIDPQVYYDAGVRCSDSARSMREHVDAVRSSLYECGGMAGGYDRIKAWSAAYDEQSDAFFRAAETWVAASNKMSELLEVAGHNYALADFRANPNPGKGPPPSSPPVSDAGYRICPVPPPSCLGSNGDGIDTDVPGLLEQIGISVPDGDSDKLGRASDAWQSFSKFGDAATNISSTISAFGHQTAPDVESLTGHLRTLQTGADELASTASALAWPVADHRDSLQSLRVDIDNTSNDLLIQLAIVGGVTAIVAIATTLLTFGAALAGPTEAEVSGGAASATAMIAAAANTIRGFITASSLIGIVGAAAGTFAAIQGVTTLSALEAITMLVAQRLPEEGVGAEGQARGEINESAKEFSDAERRIADLLADEGHDVVSVLEAGDRPTQDAMVDGLPVEFKSVTSGADNATVKAALNSARRQADDVIVDGRDSGLSQSEAMRGLRRFLGIEPDGLSSIRIIGDGWEIQWP